MRIFGLGTFGQEKSYFALGVVEMSKPTEEVCPNPNDAMRRFPGLPKTNTNQGSRLNQSRPTLLP
jgi:hypothetical protein